MTDICEGGAHAIKAKGVDHRFFGGMDKLDKNDEIIFTAAGDSLQVG